MNGGKLEEEDKQALLDIHNEYRSDTALGRTGSQPMAQDMAELIWDEGLENDAKEYANRCVFEHDPKNDSQGENLFTAVSSIDNVDNIDRLLKGMFRFYNEHQYYNFDNGRCTRQPCGHYTQVVWADTTKVGCAYSECSSIQNFRASFPHQILMVCRYLSPGNWYGKKPYAKTTNKSEVATRCPEGYVGNKDSGLCKLSTATNNSKEFQVQVTPSPTPKPTQITRDIPTPSVFTKPTNNKNEKEKDAKENASNSDLLISLSDISTMTNSEAKESHTSNDIGVTNYVPPPTDFHPDNNSNSKSKEKGSTNKNKEKKDKNKQK